MEDDRTNSKRPGRKALFVGATTRPPANGDKKADDSGEAFAAEILQTIEKYSSGEAEVRIQEEIIDKKYTRAAESINKLLDSYSESVISQDISPETEELKLQLEKLKGDYETRIEQYIEKISELEANGQSEDYSTEIEELKQETAQKEQQIQSIKAKAEKSEEEIQQNLEKISGLEEKIKGLNEENEQLKQETAQKEQRIQSIKAEAEKSEEERETLKTQYEERIGHYLEKIPELEENNKTLSKEIDQLKEYPAKIEKLKQETAQKEQQIQSIKAETVKNNKEREKLKAEYEAKIRQNLDKISALEENNKRLSDKNLELSGKEKTEHEELQKAKAENDLRNKYYNAAIRENPMPVLIADRNLRIKLCNNAFEIMSGIPEQKLKSMSIKDFNIIEKKGDDYLKAIETGRRSRSELKVKMPSGTRFLEQYAIPVRINGNVELLLIYNDITKEKEEAEEITNKIAEIETLKKRSEIIVQENPMPILLMNRKLGIIVANPAFEEMSGIPLHNISKMSARDFRVLKQKGEGLKHTLENKIRASGEVEIEMPSGIHILEQYSIPILNDKREIINILAVYNDVTEIRRKNAEIEELREKEREEAKLLTESTDIITEKMIGMTSGDLTVSVEIFEDDPLALLKTHFNSSVKEFSDLISVINEKANVIESTSEELSSNSDDIAKANEKLALNSEESAEFLRDLMERFERISLGISDLSASIEEISSTSQEVTRQANQAAVEGKNAAEIGKEASENMENVGRISQQSVNEINLLNQEMYKINDIVKLIGGIAEQTNMLALNAAIEAARAGEHGRGFSVVAGEIRNLAGESKEATRTIELLISEIQKNSNNTANSMRQADDEIQTGIESVNLAVNALNNIANDIEIASRGITEISHATETQAYEINSFMKNIEEANALTRGNLEKLEGMAAMAEEISATTEEVGSISHEMHNLSSDLQETMKKFRMNST